jgi:hypothetical protein
MPPYFRRNRFSDGPSRGWGTRPSEACCAKNPAVGPVGSAFLVVYFSGNLGYALKKR